MSERVGEYDFLKIAFIREEECIGCTKCIQVCPTDAILGASKMIHTILEMDCTGCGLCVPACPVDCISFHDDPKTYREDEKLSRTLYFKERSQLKNERLLKKEVEKIKYDPAKIKFEIEQSVLRFKQKRNLET